ncbi:MAG: isoaspartyl peptidase/L-asparaginase [Deltaproteobacteria bacterium]|nr:isoaspartyl peptidase/L-asparaginase [Deltaproteobacteria bacterium]
MKSLILLILGLLSFSIFAHSPIPNVILAIHGGTTDSEEIPKNLEPEVIDGLFESLKAGYAVLKTKGSSLDAVEAAVKSLEDNPLFNAGKGAVFTSQGKNEMDASIMEGSTKKAGAVASVTQIKNPISAARAVMEKTRHVLLVGDGADQFAKAQGLKIVSPKYFYTDRRWKEWQKSKAKQNRSSQNSSPTAWNRHFSLGTVGSVALDIKNGLAAATSTGGLTDKMHGRVGDSPIIGAGTFADNETAAISCTGVGEYFIRYGIAREISSLIKYKQLNVAQAADTLIQNTLKPQNVEGGTIVLDPKGYLAFSYNAEGLPRGYVTQDGTAHLFVFDKEVVRLLK